MALVSKNIPPPKNLPVHRALLSVFDKTGIVEFARELASLGCVLVSTGGTAKALQAAGLKVSDVWEITGFPEIMDGRVKTLHPKVHGALLGIRDDEGHRASMREHGIEPFDLVVINLYPFEEAIASGADFNTAIETVDIGGPAMIRASAKNHAYAGVVVDPADYIEVLAAIKGGGLPIEMRRRLAAKAFARTASYDAAIGNWFAREVGEELPLWRNIAGRLGEPLRYGENPHQRAGFYLTGDKRPGVASARQLQGKQLSYNNINDTDAAYELVAEFDPSQTAAVAIIKHANPCGVAEAKTLAEAYRMALRCDPISAFGGIVAMNRTLDAEAASEMVKIFTEVIIAPDAAEEAIAIVAGKKNLRLLIADGLPDPSARGWSVRSVAGGLLIQDRDNARVDEMDLRVVSKRAPTAQEMADMKLAFRICKHVKSNAIVYVKNAASVGIGAGQMSRVDSAVIAARKAADAARQAGLAQSLAIGSVVASDAFFPFADGLLAAAEAGATAVIQPGGSVRDDEVIAAADAANLAMVFTGVRHFRH